MAMPRLIAMLVRPRIMKQAPINLIALGIGSLLVAACAGDKGQYPSLAVRDMERVDGQIDTGPPVEPVTLDISPVIPSQSVAELIAQARVSHRDFLAREPSARRLASSARGSGRDSEARGNAIVALADLTSMRSKTEIPLAGLDLLIAERTNRLESAEDAVAAHAEVLKLVAAQDRTLDNLWSMLGR